MKNKGSEIKDQGSEAMTELLRRAISPFDSDPTPPHDLWPTMQARLNAQPPPLAARLRAVPWFDWALVGGLAIFSVAFPAAVPMLLYYL